MAILENGMLRDAGKGDLDRNRLLRFAQALKRDDEIVRKRPLALGSDCRLETPFAQMASFGPSAVISAVDHIEATISQLDCPSVGSGHVSEMDQLGNRHCNSGICPEVRIQGRHYHAGPGFAVRLTKEIEDLARRFAELH